MNFLYLKRILLASRYGIYKVYVDVSPTTYEIEGTGTSSKYPSNAQIPRMTLALESSAEGHNYPMVSMQFDMSFSIEGNAEGHNYHGYLAELETSLAMDGNGTGNAFRGVLGKFTPMTLAIETPTFARSFHYVDMAINQKFYLKLRMTPSVYHTHYSDELLETLSLTTAIEETKKYVPEISSGGEGAVSLAVSLEMSRYDAKLSDESKSEMTLEMSCSGIKVLGDAMLKSYADFTLADLGEKTLGNLAYA